MTREQLNRFNQEAMPYLDPIWQVAVWLAPDEQLAEMLVEDTFIEAYRSWNDSSLEDDRKIALLKILISILRRNGDLKYHSNFDRDISKEELFSPYQNATVNSVSKESIAAAIRNLPPENRLLIVLSVFIQCNYSEIADITGNTYDTVSFYIYEGYAHIRREILKSEKFTNLSVAECG
jgi:RNA polymerase sigma-70 factor, ECF subfamily